MKCMHHADCKEIGVRTFEFVVKTHFLCTKIYIYKICLKIVGVNGSYSENTEPIWKRRYPRGA